MYMHAGLGWGAQLGWLTRAGSRARKAGDVHAEWGAGSALHSVLNGYDWDRLDLTFGRV